MLSWFEANLGSILVALVLAGAAALIVRGLIRDRKRGRHICGGSCGQCAAGCAGSCAGCAHCAHSVGKAAGQAAER